MRILQIVHDFPPNNFAGVEIYTYNLSKELFKNNKVFIFRRINNPAQEEYKIDFKKYDGLSIYTINNTFKYCYSFEGFYKNDIIDRKFAKVLDFINPDIVHIQHLIFLSVGIIKEIYVRNIPVVCTLHDYWLICPQWHYLKKNSNNICTGKDESECIKCLDYKLNLKRTPKKIYNFFRKFIPRKLIPLLRKVYLKFNKKDLTDIKTKECIRQRKNIIGELLGKVDYFIAPSIFIKKKFIKYGISKDKIIHCNHGIDTKLFGGSFEKKTDIITFGFIGTILPAKGLHILIKAFNRIKVNSVRLKVYGKLYSYRDFESYPMRIKRIVSNVNIDFEGGFDNQQISSVFSNIDVLVVPSIWYENSPLTIQEAFASKTPVIASCIGGIPELVKNNYNGLLFSAGDINDLYRKMKLIIDNPELIKKLRDNINPPKKIENNSKEIEEIYKKIIK